jgi:hypothetical protein
MLTYDGYARPVTTPVATEVAGVIAEPAASLGSLVTVVAATDNSAPRRIRDVTTVAGTLCSVR